MGVEHVLVSQRPVLALAVWQYLKFSDRHSMDGRRGCGGNRGSSDGLRPRPWLHFVRRPSPTARRTHEADSGGRAREGPAIELFIRGRRVRQLVLPMCIWAMTLPTVVPAR